jgi:hypothetical protein
MISKILKLQNVGLLQGATQGGAVTLGHLSPLGGVPSRRFVESARFLFAKVATTE